jgi:hypothetical protein
MTTITNNGARKTLASQLDRLDSILDGLAENLNEAVAMAAAGGVKDVVSAAVQEAVHAALVEILTNAEVRKRLFASPTTNVPVPLTVRIAAKVRTCWSWLVGTAKGTWAKVVVTARMAIDKVKTTTKPLVTAANAKAQQIREEIARRARSCWMLAVALAAIAKRFRTQLVVAAGVGVLVGAVCYLGGREIASIGCGVAGFVGSLAGNALSRLRQLLPFLVASNS